ncbi:cryptochrome/photolyase family protein [Nocardia amikacinitolerans]|uniref:cryptochrome/photolyase family protein n=1 Tax=Nocardia amikacinitolerans TaxID=756689 RepID=UPI0020A26FC9|nr:deoxyribodipyrimidine photo-lyase [Nocardia amikacinitolerans]MCP2276735.1 deoxyribodipyrimidine photo-lyase [Nocardia amikacinitolerans]
MTTSVALFTRDLRVHDNPVLTAAHRTGDTVVPLFVVDRELVPDRCPPNRAHFLAAALAELDDELRAIGGRLVLRRGDVVDEVDRVVAETGAAGVHLAEDVSGYSRSRARRLRERLRDRDCRVDEHAATVTAVDPELLVPSTGRDHFSVFTPYFRRWTEAHRRKPLGKPRALTLPRIAGDPLPKPEDLCTGESSPHLAVGGETTGRKLLRDWLSGPLADYARLGDDLAADATSHLSPYLHFGCLSPAEVVHRVDMSTEGGQAFARQLAWRDFHHQHLAARPEAAWHDYRARQIRWRDDPRAVDAWRDGRTGYPIVDAGMRQLRAEGWMPNRARLITASFLTKSLRVHWRIGAAHFLHLLVDADLANNQLNWQWVAGTGTDTRPHRVLNPLRQAKRYDPDGDYVRRWIPELAHLEGPRIHLPWRADADYPAPIVDCVGM